MKKQLTKVCVRCGRLHANTGEWIIMGLGTGANITHGICPRCKRKWLKEAISACKWLKEAKLEK